MNVTEFETLMLSTFDQCRRVLTSKGSEYSTGSDRLGNFKRAASARGVIPEEALLGMKIKHTISIDDMVRELSGGAEYSIQRWDEKIIDDINYLILLRALLVERSGRASKEVDDDD